MSEALQVEDETELRRRVAQLDLTQKVRLLTGTDFWSVGPEPAIGLRRLVVSDGPAGVRGELWDDRDWSVSIPSPTAVAATWDEELVSDLGRLLAREARRKGVDVVLGPTVNLHRTPYGGRHFECYSEDPVLTGRVGAAMVAGLQSEGVGACVKHFVANDQETDRMTVDEVIDDRTLRELYLAPFEQITMLAHPWSYMAAYNGVNGVTMTESPLIDDVLKGEWGSDGLVMSDWFATRSTRQAGAAGLDLAMPGPVSPWGAALVAAVEAGDVPESAVDEKVLRLLRLARRCGALDGFAAMPAPQAWPSEQTDALTRHAAAASFVLVKNDGVLPLGRPASIAVIGPNALRGRVMGGGSATVFPRSIVHPVDGLAAAFADADVRTSVGVRSSLRVPAVDAAQVRLPDDSDDGLLVEFVNAAGTVVGQEARRTGNLRWVGGFGDDIDAEAVSGVRVRFAYTAPASGSYQIGFSGVGHGRVVLGERTEEVTLSARPGADVVETMTLPPQFVLDHWLDAGTTLPVTIEFAPVDDPAMAMLWGVQVNLDTPHGTDDEELAQAEQLAASCDAVVVVLGTTEEVESEGYDRTSLALPGRQDELVQRVLAANPNTVVVVNSGSPVLMPWLDQARAVLLTWFPGEQMGAALGDVLSGMHEPGGRMPTTWPAPGAEVAPVHTSEDGRLRYAEGLHIGYRGYLRADVEPAVPFGHGLGYTQWRLGEATEVDGGVAVEVSNVGDRAGSQVVQVYLSRTNSAVERPRRWLAGFSRVELAAGASATVQIDLPPSALRHWDAEAATWRIEPGDFLAEVGFSIADLGSSVTLSR